LVVEVGGAFNVSHFSDWVGTTLMDPAEPFFFELLREQLALRVARVAQDRLQPRREPRAARLELRRDVLVREPHEANGLRRRGEDAEKQQEERQSESHGNAP
jgi:hypothetical protein